MDDILAALSRSGEPLLGTWVKLPTLETLEMLAIAGFEAVVIDTEHGPHTHETTYKLIFGAQALGMAAIVRLPDLSGHDVQRVLDAGADGILLPRVMGADEARKVVHPLIFSPEGGRGLGSTSRAGKWGMIPMKDYLEKGRERTLRMVQLEDWEAIEDADAVCQVEGVNGIFLGLGDLMLSTGLPPKDPKVVALVEKALAAAKKHDIPCGVAAGNAEDAARYRDMGFSLVMVSNDCTLFGRAAASLVTAYKEG